MPQDLTNGQNGQKNIGLNLDALGDVIDQQVGFANSEPQEKPTLENPVEAEILKTDFQLMTRQGLRTNANDPSKKYYNTVFAVTTHFKYNKIDENGKVVELETDSRDNYSGLRFFPKLNENGQPILLADGTPELERFWMGDKSAFGRLFALVKKADPRVETYRDFFKFFAPGRKCTVKTEYTTSPDGKATKKQFIQSFL